MGTKETMGKALEAIEKAFGKGAIMKLTDEAAVKVATFPSGSLALDLALGIGGYPRGRMVEIFGPEASGKTTLTLMAIAELQRLGGTAAFIDAEHALDPGYAEALGVDLERLLVAQPDSGEQALEIAEILVREGSIDLVVIDSVAALVPKAEIEGDMGDHHVGLQARLMSQALRKLTAITFKHDTTIVFINQIRNKIGVAFGNPETTTGGNALKFYSSVRLDVRRIGAIKEGTVAVGNRTRVKVVKNKMAPPFREAEFDMVFGVGINREGEILDQAADLNIVDKSGSWYSVDGERLGQGRDKACEALRLAPALLRRLENGVREHHGLPPLPLVESPVGEVLAPAKIRKGRPRPEGVDPQVELADAA
ncbi:MAG: protein RecA [Myxococcales bacterium]